MNTLQCNDSVDINSLLDSIQQTAVAENNVAAGEVEIEDLDDITINITIALRPLTMNLRGIFDSAITIAKNAATTRYSHILLPRNRDITNIKVPISLTLGSSLCITESA